MARAEDIRLKVDFFGHPKTQKLRSALGNDGVLSLIELWCWVARVKPKGHLNGIERKSVVQGPSVRPGGGCMFEYMCRITPL